MAQCEACVINVESYPSFNEAVLTIGSAKQTLRISSPQFVTSSITVPATLTLWFVGCGELQVSAGVTVTILGAIVSAPIQIFTGAGTVSISGNTNLPVRYEQWWGTTTPTVTMTSPSGALIVGSDPGGTQRVRIQDTLRVGTAGTSAEVLSVYGNIFCTTNIGSVFMGSEGSIHSVRVFGSDLQIGAYQTFGIQFLAAGTLQGTLTASQFQMLSPSVVFGNDPGGAERLRINGRITGSHDTQVYMVRNAAGTASLGCLGLSPSNELMLWQISGIGDVGKVVSAGAVDSGGAGFRILRIPN